MAGESGAEPVTLLPRVEMGEPMGAKEDYMKTQQIDTRTMTGIQILNIDRSGGYSPFNFILL